MKKIRKFLSKIKKRLIGRRDRWPLKKRIKGAVREYEKYVGHSFDIYHPELYTEKLIWYKVFYKHPDQARMVDKSTFKDYVREKLGEGYTIPLYGVWDTVNELRQAWESLPEEFVLKSTVMGTGHGIRVIRHKSREDLDAICREVKEWLDPYNTLINTFCSAYYDTKPRVLAEKYESEVGDQLYDYKVVCFGGEPHCVYAVTDHYPGQLSHISFYDLDWNKLDVRYGAHKMSDVPRPDVLPEMLRIAKIMSKDFPFLRVDFFIVGGKPVLSETTFYPGGGIVRYDPISFDKELGDLFILPENRE